MAFLTVWGEPGCRAEEVARLVAQSLGFEFISEARLRAMLAEEFGTELAIPEKAWAAAVTSILARLALESPLAVAVEGGEMMFPRFPAVLRVGLIAPESRRVGMLMLEHRMERPAAQALLQQLERQAKLTRKQRFGKSVLRPSHVDLVINLETLETDHATQLIEAAARAKGLPEEPVLSPSAEAQIQFQLRLQLSRFGITPPGKVALKRKQFANQSEEIFANMLDFYRIAWEYEPRSFILEVDASGKPAEAFTPDFYLPEFDLFVELTTMKQAHVTRKNRKVKRLRELYPHINIQVFYQKDFRNLIFKYGLAERGVTV